MPMPGATESPRVQTASPVLRPFREEDIGQAAELHRSVFKTGRSMTAGLLARYDAYFREVFLGGTPHSEELPSIVYEEAGKVMGFVGSVARPMRMNGRPVLARVTSQFAVDPRCRGMAGVKMLQKIFNGPQDLTIADES